MTRYRIAATAALAALLLAGTSLQGDELNLLPNASFEDAAGEQPASWSTHTWAGKGQFEYAAAGRSGDRCLVISSEPGGDLSWHTTVSVDPRGTYRLSGWIKTENVNVAKETNRRARGALFNIHNLQSVATPAITGSNDWTRVEIVFEANGEDAVQINCLFGGWGLATGRAWFDDVRLEALSTSDWNPQITIDAAKKGHPVSPYIYGQFIEHLGRCIYGGIWAEMLEDRKFYFPITAEYDPYRAVSGVAKDAEFPVVGASPWQITGPADSVQMIEQDSFVGQHTPQVASDSGIQQKDLGVTRGKDYVGYVWLKAAGDGISAQVSLSDADGKLTITNVAQQFTRYSFRFAASRSTDQAVLQILIKGGDCLVGTASMMPADNVEGMRADTLALLKELNSPVYRWPGGNFVSGYDWRDGVGERDRRPPRKNPAWTGVEHNDFGMHEFITFCRLLDTEPLIVVNSGLGKVEHAVEELQYANGTSDTPMGKLRGKNGHSEPFRVKWWGVGNEMYGGWQLGHMPLEKYIAKNNEYADAMWAEDDSIKLVAVGATGPWSEGMMQHCADHMDLISEHFYRRERPGLAGHVRQMADAVRQKADAHRDYRRRFDALNGKDIDIALDEWNYWYGPHVYGELGTRYFLKDGLGVAAALHEYVRQSDIMFMANYAQTVNVIGCIKTTKTQAEFETTGLVLQLYRQHFGQTPLSVTTETPLDVAAALTSEGNVLTIGIVNPTMRALDLPLDLQGVQLAGNGRRWQIAGDDPDAYNEPGVERRVRIEETVVRDLGTQLSVAPCSVTLFALELK